MSHDFIFHEKIIISLASYHNFVGSSPVGGKEEKWF
jgi:hypothetical protein